MLVARFHHPTGSCQMIVVNDAGTIWFKSRVETKDNSHCFTPISTFFCSVEQAEIGHKVTLIVRRKLCAGWRAIIKGWDGHGSYF